MAWWSACRWRGRRRLGLDLDVWCRPQQQQRLFFLGYVGLLQFGTTFPVPVTERLALLALVLGQFRRPG
jgi:hypothetical protein